MPDSVQGPVDDWPRRSAMEADIRQLYDSDPRPTFIVDGHAQSTTIYHVNTALLAIREVALSLHSHDALRDWWDPASRVASRHQKEFRHGRYRWAKFIACQRWLVVTVLEQPRPSDEQRPHLLEPAQLSRVASPLQETRPATIFTVKIQSKELREHIDYIRAVKWSQTSLGPINTWSYELNVLVTTLMLDTRPTALFLGPERTILYNLAYGAVSGSRHPAILGRSIIDAWPELADPVSATIARAQQTSFVDAPAEEYHFMVERYGFVEEAFFMWSLVPLVGVGNIDGMYSIVTEITKQRLLERRVDALLKVGQLTSKARDTADFWRKIAEAITPYEYDFPVAILYSQCELLDIPDSTGVRKGPLDRSTLEWQIGYEANHPAIPKHIDLGADHGLRRVMTESARSGAALVHSEEDGVLPVSLYHDIQQRAFGDPLRAFLTIPIRTYDQTIVGYLFMGVNTRRPYDAEYKDWIKVFSNLLGASAASVALHEEEIRNRQQQEEQAARDREALNAEVAVLTQEASHAAEKLQNFHDIANEVGLGYFEIDANGMLVHANETYFTQTGHWRDIASAPPFAYRECVYEEDLEMVETHWKTLVAGEPVTFEIRWKKQPNDEQWSENDHRAYLWTLCACVPIKSEDGTVTGVFGCNTDISAQKEATRTAILQSEAERRLASFTELAPVGMYHLDAGLRMKYCNEKWFHITGFPKVPLAQIDWREVVHEDDMALIYREIDVCWHKKTSHTFSIRLRKQWTAPDGVITPTWILVIATTQFDREGNPDSIMGTMTDISQLKWAEEIQKSRVKDALESKRQQENFIDMTSHEMRNPLSAMVQCADSIYSSLRAMGVLTREDALAAQPILHTQLNDMIKTSLEAIETIQACATHQKRIVDDILTLSKLDSKLLVISPIILQPVTLLQDAYKMFRDEANKVEVHLEARCDPSISALKVDWAILDPSRVLQVLINLLTNAIKFTQGQPTRNVEVIMGASLEAERLPEVEYVPQEALRKEFLAQSEWDHAGEVFYLSFTVKDTGCGLSPEHKAKLFLRFSQATPKTHVQYGGSGLGLFISRELTEMQGGSIGVASTQNVGSTFSFYIKSRRAPAPSHKLFPDPQVFSRTKAQIICDQNTSPDTPGAQAPEEKQKEKEDEGEDGQEETNYHILVVEDNLINQRVLSNLLKKLGCTVHVTNHGLEALSILERSTFASSLPPSTQQEASPSSIPSHPIPLSVILMDVEMPIMDGLTCTRRIRAMEASGQLRGHVPIIAVSANARREQVELAKEAGMDDAICKPFRIPELMHMIQKLGIRGVGAVKG